MIFESKQKVETVKVCMSCGGKSQYAFLTSRTNCLTYQDQTSPVRDSFYLCAC